MSTDPRRASDPSTAQHHWYPFLKYQEECKAAGKEATVTEWMRSSGKLNDRIAFEEAKKQAEAAAATAAADKKKTEK